jgi:chemotaxis protein MotB
MARKRHHEEHTNHEAWAIPYGDLITLLLAFFVVMYALSSVNEGKYRVLSDSLVAAFRAAPRSLEPIQVGELSRSPGHDTPVHTPRTLVPLEVESLYRPPEEQPKPEPDWAIMRRAGLSPQEVEAAAKQIDKLSTAINGELANLVTQDLVRVRQSRFWVEIEINTSLLFSPGSAKLADQALPIVRRVGAILSSTTTRIQVEGHTDVVPINTSEFPSNWELSAARAATVVRMFAEAGVDPVRMAAVGYGEYQPVADNDTPEGRARNRRVTIVVMAAHPEAAGGGTDDPPRAVTESERKQTETQAPTNVAIADP